MEGGSALVRIGVRLGIGVGAGDVSMSDVP